MSQRPGFANVRQSPEEELSLSVMGSPPCRFPPEAIWLDGEGIPVRLADNNLKETLNLSECQGAAVCLLLNGQSLAKR